MVNEGVGSIISSPWRHGIKNFEIKFYLDLSIKMLFSVFMSCKECFIENVSKHSHFDFKCFKTIEFQITEFGCRKYFFVLL